MQKGLITNTPAGRVWVNGGAFGNQVSYYDASDIELTQEGSKYKVGESVHNGDSFVLMKVADRVFGEITGIRESPGGDSAEVDFTWKYVNVTPFGELFTSEGKTFTQTVTLKKYDDGWRMPTDWSLLGNE